VDFYITSPDGTRIRLPINPASITAQTESRMVSFETISAGSMEVPRGIKPARITWDGMFPGADRRNSGIVENWVDPKTLVGTISGWRRSNARLRLLITETPINLECFIAAFEHTWQGGHGDCSYRLELVEARRFSAIATQGQQTQARAVAATPRTHTVAQGDTLWRISARLLGNGSRWREIYTLNQAIIGKNPNIIRAGQVLRMP